MSTLPTTLRLGTRGSLLARTQSQLIINLLTPHLPPHTKIELIPITTTGDTLSAKTQHSALSTQHSSFDKANFVKELDEHLLANKIDFAVHSAKDLPVIRPDGIALAATPPRENPADVWISKDNLSIEQLPPHSRVGTASLRRQAQLLALRPDLQIIPLRGNIDTRLKKIADGHDQLAATFLAAAGLLRTNLLPPSAKILPTENFIPAAGQGTLAIEARSADASLLALLQKIHHSLTAASLLFERSIIHSLSADCLSPIGVCAEPRAADPGWIIRAIALTPDGKKSARCALMTHSSEPQALLDMLPLALTTLERRGAREILHPKIPS